MGECGGPFTPALLPCGGGGVQVFGWGTDQGLLLGLPFAGLARV
jgi:hypothetical protein